MAREFYRGEAKIKGCIFGIVRYNYLGDFFFLLTENLKICLQ
ncbi:hypothetical protein HMPREF0239_04608 [Clostridium sp. ATCC BAA-442]|nr:hypothetical protein HMPREF0239_04608 [Clostridium sp. ATCC BAA-442]